MEKYVIQHQPQIRLILSLSKVPLHLPQFFTRFHRKPADSSLTARHCPPQNTGVKYAIHTLVVDILYVQTALPAPADQR